MTLGPLMWLAGTPDDAARAVTVGVFDGVHLGHRALLQRLREESVAGLVPTVLTFDRHPLSVVAPERAPERLTADACRLDLLRQAGAAAVVALPFDAKVAALGPEAFVRDVLLARLHARVAVVSSAFRFGAGGRGDSAALQRIGRELGLEVREVPPLMLDGRRVSSTRVRQALRTGDVERATRLLGRHHVLDGVVERGVGRGRELGFPTANLGGLEVLAPAEGIYAAWARWAGELRAAAVFVGRRLTFEGDRTVEAHLLDTDAELYGARLTLGFVRRLRDDRRFAGKRELAAQIADDVQTTRTTLAALLSTIPTAAPCCHGSAGPSTR
ncbi:MAG: riboflavin biosynthesis protein RibF [Deltaproteobacteria bacterium]|nr:riboflavin biosynthesis protein RibF [Deltaproteobacteria bacterium]